MFLQKTAIWRNDGGLQYYAIINDDHVRSTTMYKTSEFTKIQRLSH